MDITQTLDTIMTVQTISVAPTDSYTKIEQIFKENNFHHIPVLNEDMNVLGIISTHDIEKVLQRLTVETTGKTYSKFTLDSLTAKDIMTSQLIQLSPENTIAVAAKFLLKNRFHAIPIVEKDKLVGIVTNHDLLKFAYDISYEFDHTQK